MKILIRTLKRKKRIMVKELMNRKKMIKILKNETIYVNGIGKLASLKFNADAINVQREDSWYTESWSQFDNGLI